MAQDLYIVTGVRLCEMEEDGGVVSYKPYLDKDSHVEILIKDKSFKILNVLLVGKYGSLVIQTKSVKTAIRLFESIKLLLAFVELYYDEDMSIFRLDNDLSETKNYKIYDLYHHSNFFAQDQLESGIILGSQRIKQLKELLKLIFRDSRLRTALACFYQSQVTYYTHLVGSYISSHSRVDLYSYERDEYSFLNMINYERLCSSLTSAYRGIEAIMDYNFRERHFENDYYKKIINDRIPGVKWNTKYLKAFDKVRYDDLRKKRYSKVSTMIKKLLIARNRAGHGKVYANQKKNNPITMELTHESKRFLEFLIMKYIESKIDINKL
ncbi:hypothetical protein [Saccharococcus caldoxylosilyticus]|uniref:Uncharacterized protein n=1 Tax=Saccharococcus caldoxylosilyticus TaxID=81408 RepID=A0A150KWD3_9BACL|nr:hypothetical protein [Parageobacillus caldoxylosilyticus]KYD04129.1 hypothetical protein B4119_0164 [Parageobacillus caldoxylosilyticus]QXJ38289.1 hypothetical protein BV455_01603 [Parageobacillus caldoxylosilyticus]